MAIIPVKNSCDISPKIFISHRHRDRCIADGIREQLQSWGINSIFQSSSYRHSGKVGNPINTDIKNFLEETQLVILIYTFPDTEWDYCMFECGFATNSQDTNIVVFKCGHHQPRVFSGELHVTADLDGISRFVHQIHKDDGFFPGQLAFDPKLSDEALSSRSQSLFNALQDVLPKRKPYKAIRWGHFALSIPTTLVEGINTADTSDKAYEHCTNELHNIQVIGAEGYGLKHFGYHSPETELSFSEIIQRWKDYIYNNNQSKICDEDIAWIRELTFELTRSLRNEPPQLSWIPLKSASHDLNWLVCPVINEIDHLSDGSAELKVYMYRVDRIENIEKGVIKRIFLK